jgi:transcriptional regulator with XRE-family HTH domain
MIAVAHRGLPDEGSDAAMTEVAESHFREWLRVHMRARSMSIRLLAHRSGVNASTISRIVRGERRPSLRTAIRLAQVLRGDTDESTVTYFENSFARRATDPVAVVERALRSDERLTDADVRRVMLLYQAVRSADAPAETPPRLAQRRAQRPEVG